MNAIPASLHKRLLDSLNTAVVLLDHQLVVRYVNPAAEQLLSLSAQRLVGEPLPACFQAEQDARDGGEGEQVDAHESQVLGHRLAPGLLDHLEHLF